MLDLVKNLGLHQVSNIVLTGKQLNQDHEFNDKILKDQLLRMLVKLHFLALMHLYCMKNVAN